VIHSWPIESRAEWLGRRRKNVNASEVAALFGADVHPYLSPFKLWALKCGKAEDEAETPAMRRGKLFEPVVIEILREDHPDWRLHPATSYLWDDESRIGCTPDCYAERADIQGHGVVQIKTVGSYAFKRMWHDEDGDVAVPTWVAVQASVEAYLTGAVWAAVAALRLGDGGIDIALCDIPLKPHLIHKIEDLVGEFWRRVDANDPYEPDFGRDRKLVFDLYAEGHGPPIDLTDDAEFRQWLDTRARFKDLEKAGEVAATERKALDARIIHRMGNAPAASCASRIVSVKVVKKRAYSVKAQQYPLLSVKGV
jgi:predicted phage-related endonuclease